MKENNLKFEHVVIIPVYNEEIDDILRVIHSIAIQQSDSGVPKSRAIVFNINNSTAESKETGNLAYQNNLISFKFLQELATEDKDLSSYFSKSSAPFRLQMIEVIRTSLKSGQLYISTIDSFSLGHTRDHNTLGFAREFATRYAVDNLTKDENSLLFSTDADCIFAIETMSEADKMFATHDIDLAPLNMDYHFYNLDDRSCRSAVMYRLSRLLVENLINLSTSFSTHHRSRVPNSLLLKKAFNVGGAFTVIRAGKYGKSLGYPDGPKEDLYIVASIRGVGGKIDDLRKNYPKAIIYTSPRMSDRVTAGYGAKIAGFSRDEKDFFKYQVTNIDAHLDIVACIRQIEEEIGTGNSFHLGIIATIVNQHCFWLNDALKVAFIQELKDVFSNNPLAFYNDAHWNLSNGVKRLLRNKNLPQQTIYDQVQLLESIYAELGLDLLQVEEGERKEYPAQGFLEYQSFKETLLERIKSLSNLDINKILPVATCSIANHYLQTYIPGFKELTNKSQSCSATNKLLEECEVRLLEAVIYGYKGDLDLATEAEFLNRLKLIKCDQ